VNSVGVVTARDNLTVQWTPDKVFDIVSDFASLPVEKARDHYNLGKDARDWKVSFAQDDLKKSKISKNKIVPIYYRPFDIRYTFYTGKSRGFICMPRPEIMGHMLAGKNVGLVLPRRVETAGAWQHILVAQDIIEHVIVSSKTIDYLLPLYTYPTTEFTLQPSLLTSATIGRTPNLSHDFVDKMIQDFGLKFISNGTGDLKKTFGPEDVLHYIYAVFHSPAYRSRYAEFLKIDFPRLPLTSNVELFRQLCGLGKELVALHLLEASALNKPITKFKGKGDNIVAKGHPKYQDGVVLVNASQGFEGVPEDVWEFHIGGYQVCEKWLKDRRERELSAEDIVHYGKVVSALGETIRIMKEVDGVIKVNGGWPVK
jgi:predicted helicase